MKYLTDQEQEQAEDMEVAWNVAKIVVIFLFGVLCGVVLLAMVQSAEAQVVQPAIPADQAVRAIIGEAADQGYEGMLAVACAIRNRGTLKGVYGLGAKHIDKEPEWVWDLARKAWKNSAECDVTKGADHWENIKAFGKPYWADKCEKTYTHKDHVFYMCEERPSLCEGRFQ
jgi:hypothetical protein